MERKKVSSGNLRTIGYDEASQVLEAEFTSGAVYQYSRVSRETYRRLMGASSPWSFFRDHIEEEYSSRRVK